MERRDEWDLLHRLEPVGRVRISVFVHKQSEEQGESKGKDVSDEG
jgi:hypothetical protein